MIKTFNKCWNSYNYELFAPRLCRIWATKMF